MRSTDMGSTLEAISRNTSQIDIAPFETFSNSEVGNGLIARSEPARTAFLPTFAPAGLDFEPGKWHEGVKAIETFSRAQQKAWDRDAIELKARMQLLEHRTHAQLVDLSNKVDLLTQMVSTAANLASTETVRTPALVQSETSLGRAVTASEALAEHLNCVADGELVPTQEWRNQALSSLSDSDPVLRSAAGRALCVLDPAMAAELLPQTIAIEKNRVVASVLKGALRALP